MKRDPLSCMFVLLLVFFLGLGMLHPAVSRPSVVDDRPLGTLDAWIVGRVDNTTMGVNVSCQSIYTPNGGQPVLKYYNGTTGPAGNFNITVDSNTWGADQEYSPFNVEIIGDYYQTPVAGKERYIFDNVTYSGNVSRVPNGLLEVFTEPLSNLTIEIINASSGEPLENARVELVYPPGFPDAPFPLAKATDASGKVVFNGIRSVNTTIAVTKLNFQPLADTEEHDYVRVQRGGDMLVTFRLEERPWPFSLVGDESDINATQNLTINFKREMDPISITDSTNYQLWKVDGEVPIDFVLAAKDENRKAAIDPLEPLEYNTSYRIRLDTGLKTKEGIYPLWRAMEIGFRTELPPGQVFGRVVSSSDGSPVPNVQVIIADQVRLTNSTGHYHFSIIPHGTYRVDVPRSFLYEASTLNDFTVSKGEIKTLEDMEVDPRPWGSLEVNVMSDDKPLEDAWVKIKDETIPPGLFNETTGPEGRVSFPRVRTGAVIVRIGADHHSIRDDMSVVYQEETAYLNVTLIEDQIPVWMEPSHVNGDGTVDPRTNVLIHVPEPIHFSSMNVTLWRTDDEWSPLEQVDVTPPEKRDNLTYVLNPPRLRMESFYKVVLGSELRAEGSMEELIWRDISLNMRTPDLELSYLNGSLLFEGMVLEGFEITFGPFSDTVDDEGGFNITVDLSSPSLMEDIVINGSVYGYGSFSRELEVGPGEVHEVGEIVLYHMDGWYSLDPMPGSGNVDPSTEVRIDLMRSIIVPDEGNWSRQISVIPESSSAPIPGTYEVLDQNRTIIFTPKNDLMSNVVYRVEISKELLQENGYPVFPLGNVTVFKVEPPAMRISVLEPSPDDTDSFALDDPIRLSFNFPVRKQLLQEGLDLDPEPNGISFQWPTPTELVIHPLVIPDTEYTMTLPVGVYGREDEPLKSPFQLVLTTSSSYSKEHNLGSVQATPATDEGWEVGQQVKFSGFASDAAGWTITLEMMKEGEAVREITTVVDENGTWSLELATSEEAGTYTISISVGVPGGPAADTWTGSVQVKETEDTTDGGGEDEDNWLIIAMIIIVVVLIIIGAVFYAANQRKKARKEIESIEYDEVESEWEDGEE